MHHLTTGCQCINFGPMMCFRWCSIHYIWRYSLIYENSHLSPLTHLCSEISGLAPNCVSSIADPLELSQPSPKPSISHYPIKIYVTRLGTGYQQIRVISIRYWNELCIKVGHITTSVRPDIVMQQYFTSPQKCVPTCYASNASDINVKNKKKKHLRVRRTRYFWTLRSS